jgi:hypothetical protein
VTLAEAQPALMKAVTSAEDRVADGFGDIAIATEMGSPTAIRNSSPSSNDNSSNDPTSIPARNIRQAAAAETIDGTGNWLTMRLAGRSVQ